MYMHIYYICVYIYIYIYIYHHHTHACTRTRTRTCAGDVKRTVRVLRRRTELVPLRISILHQYYILPPACLMTGGATSGATLRLYAWGSFTRVGG